MNWDLNIRHFSHYLKIERSLSPNSIEAYVHDVELLRQFMALNYPKVSPIKVTPNQLQGFLAVY